jgi:hypothetical protein
MRESDPMSGQSWRGEKLKRELRQILPEISLLGMGDVE